MAYFAEIDEKNIVLRIIVVDDKYELDGIAWCENFFNGGIWIQTSYTGAIRKNYAGVGHTYDPKLDAFYGLQPYPSWSLDEDCKWKAPVPYPQITKTQEIPRWDESNLKWIITEIEEV